MHKYLILAFLALAINLSAQTKQELYCNPDIVWAAIIEFDVIPDAAENQNWNEYEISGLSLTAFRQKNKPLAKNDQSLGEHMIGSIWDWEVYASSALKTTLAPQSLELNYYPNGEPETFGDLGKEIPRKEFSALRIRAILYYDQAKMLFLMKPLAAAIMRAEYDVPSKVQSYYLVGWTPISVVDEAQTAKAAWGMRIHRDLPFEAAEGFKIEWKAEEACYKMMDQIRENPASIALNAADDLDGNTTLDETTVAELGIVEVEEMDEFGFEPKIEQKAIPQESFKGVQIGFNLYWDAEKKELSAKQISFAPIYERPLIDWEAKSELQRVFLRKLK
jgi:hypothetical protein